MNILLTSDVLYPSQRGGFAASVYALAKALSEDDTLNVYVITTNQDINTTEIESDKWIKDCKLNLYYIAVPKFKKLFTQSLYFAVKGNKIKKVLDSIEFDIVHVNSFFSYMSHYIANYALSKNKKVVISPHGELFSSPLHIKSLKKHFFLKMKFVRKNIAGNTFFHITSEPEKSALKEFLLKMNISKQKNRFDIIPNIADKEIFKSSEKETSQYDFKYILFLGRISPIKNIEMLIQAFHYAKKDEIKLVIAGWCGENIEYTKFLKSLVKKLVLEEHVIFTDTRIKDDIKRNLYKNAEFTILCSHSENFGMVVLESLAQGTPVIAVKTTPWEKLEKEKCGLWIDKDVETLKNGIEIMFEKSLEEKKSFRQNAITCAMNFTSDKLVPHYKKFYLKIQNSEKSEKFNAIDWHSEIAEYFDAEYKLKRTFKERFGIWTSLIEKYVKKGNKIIDIGCGSGVFTFIAAKKDVFVTGLDGSSEMLEICERKKAENDLHNINFIKCSIENISSLLTEKYDVVICSSVIEYLDNVDSFINDVYKILKPGGYFIFSLPNSQSFYRKGEKIFFRFFGKPLYYKHVKHLFRLDKIKIKLKASDFIFLESRYYGKVPKISTLMRKIHLAKASDTLFVVAAQKK